jgi:glycosyltransferase involved in cell wall biosynthesis
MQVASAREGAGSMSRLPSVSVVIPCYRYGHYLREGVGAVLAQPGVDVRVLIIDDCSPDDSFAVAQALAAEDPRVEARRHEVNRGHIATYNEGLLEWASGDYSILISADDVMAPGALERAVAVMERDPDVGFVYGHPVSWDDSAPRPAARTTPAGSTVWTGQEWLRIVCGLGHTVITSPEVVVRTELQQRVGGYLPELPHTADVEMWMRFAAHAKVAYLKGVDQAYYRIHRTQMTTGRVPVVDLQQRKLAYDLFFERYGERVRDASKLHRLAERKIAKEALWRACRAHERRRMEITPIAELEALAAETSVGVRTLPEYWGLRWRRALGPKLTPYMQPIILSAVHRKIRSRMWWRRWARVGY